MKLHPASWFGQKAGPVVVQSEDQKAMSSMVFDGRGGSGAFGFLTSMFSSTRLLMNATSIDWEKEAQDPLKSSVLMAPLAWMMRSFPEAPLLLEERNKDAKRWEPVEDSAILDLLDKPNPFYSGNTLLMCTALDIEFGEAYWVKLRNSQKKPVQLWWVPRGMMEPRYSGDGKTFISHYRYKIGSGIDIPVEDVVHFRFGLDPRDPRRGLSSLGCLVREVAIDEHASNFTGAILKNLGIIGMIISPKVQAQGERSKTASRESVEAVKAYMQRAFTGDKRGDTLALGAPTEVQLLQYNMQGFDVGPIRDVSEERVCAAIGIPAAVVGFGTGLQQTKVGATMREMRQLAWINGVIPIQRIVADELRRSLLPDFVPNAKRGTHRMRFDSAAVPLLWESPGEKHTRVREDMKAGMIMRSEARLETGRSASAEDDVYVVQRAADPAAANPASTDKPDPAVDPSNAES